MLYETNKTVFGVDVDCIVNTINCDGFMGKGLALEFALRFPQLESNYKRDCKEKLINVNKVYLYTIDNKKIINFPTKKHFSMPSKIEWIIGGLDFFVNNYKKWNIKSIAFPLLGTSNGGLNVDEVLNVMRTKLSTLDIDVYICYSTIIDEKENYMIESLKKINLDNLQKELRLTNKQVEVLHDKRKNIKKFRELQNVEAIGIGTYSKLFKYFYNKEEIIEQFTLL